MKAKSTALLQVVPKLGCPLAKAKVSQLILFLVWAGKGDGAF